MARIAPLQQELLTIPEAAKVYRLRVSTVRALCRLGKLKCEVRNGRGPTGRITYIDRKSASQVLGVSK